MMTDFLSRIVHPTRVISTESQTGEELDAFIDSRTLEFSTKLEDAFVDRALGLGVESGMLLDVGTRVGLIALKILWQNENFFSIGVDGSSPMIDRARETATAWGLNERAFFQVGDARRMRLKNSYFDLVVSDGVLHRFSDPVGVLSEIGRVLKPRGALLIRALRRPNRLRMARRIQSSIERYGNRMRHQIESDLRSAFTRTELEQMLQRSAISQARVIDFDENHIGIERPGTTDPNSWVLAREQYR